jgi:hypothetical protein
MGEETRENGKDGATYQRNNNNQKRVSNDKYVDWRCEETQVPSWAAREEPAASDEEGEGRES